MAWIQADPRSVGELISNSLVVLESNGTAELKFQISRGDKSQETNVFAYTRDLTATAGELYFVLQTCTKNQI